MGEVSALDGRVLRIEQAGDPSGAPVFVHHGTPASRLVMPGWAADATSRGLRLISHDRAGYGGSTPKPGRTIADAAADVVAIADALGLDRFAVWGISGGGPHALACAAMTPERVVGVAALASPAPYGAEGLDFLAGMGEANVAEFSAALEGREELERFIAEALPEVLGADAAGMVDALRTLISPADQAVLDDSLAGWLVDAMREGLGPGPNGWIDDDLAFVRPWGFDPAAIRVSALVWQGEQDLFVPPDHGRWLIERIPGVHGRVTPDDGHLTLAARRIPEVHEWLARCF